MYRIVDGRLLVADAPGSIRCIHRVRVTRHDGVSIASPDRTDHFAYAARDQSRTVLAVSQDAKSGLAITPDTALTLLLAGHVEPHEPHAFLCFRAPFLPFMAGEPILGPSSFIVRSVRMCQDHNDGQVCRVGIDEGDVAPCLAATLLNAFYAVPDKITHCPVT